MEGVRLILVDTNIFLEYLLGQKRTAECGELLGRLSKGELEGVVTRFSLHSIEAVGTPEVLGLFLSNIDRSLGLSVYDTDTSEEREAASVAKSTGLDFDDAVQYYVAKKLGAEALVSFDRHFDRVDVKRKTPADIVTPR